MMQIDYFNQRRVIAEAQKDRLARTNEPLQTAKK
jgi:cytochrome c oxidase assembly factor 6